MNTLLVSASASEVVDIVALSATLSGNGIVEIAGTPGAGAFALATVNVGVTGTVVVAADTGDERLAVDLSVCQTIAATGACLAPPSPSVTTQIAGNATPTFAIFVQGNGTVPFEPATNRIFVRFKDIDGTTRGATSVAVRTQ